MATSMYSKVFDRAQTYDNNTTNKDKATDTKV